MSDQQITKEYVEKKIQNWKARITNLYSIIAEWLKFSSAYSTKKQSSIKMYEELMHKFQIPPTSLKVLDIYYKDHIVATIKPVGLWIIGANGRLDILYKNGSITLVDESEQFKEPEWFAYSRSGKDNGKSFDQEYFLQLLGSH